MRAAGGHGVTVISWRHVSAEVRPSARGRLGAGPRRSPSWRRPRCL